jgi:hypothetical protein
MANNITTGGGSLDGGRLLVELANKDPRQAQLIQNLIDGINTVAQNTATSPVGAIEPPKSPDSVSVAVAGEYMHISHSLTGTINRGIQHLTEISTTPSFAEGSTLVVDHGCSRTSHPFSLPTKDGNGKTYNYYVRGYCQYPGSAPSKPYTVGGASQPTAFQMGGTTQMTLLSSHGSGTGPNTGKSGEGLGTFQKRSN